MNTTRFAFTLANPTMSALARLHALEGVDFLIYSKEQTPKGSLFHLQGYIEMKFPINPFKLKHLLGGAFYIEPARESKKANCKYCLKCGNPFYMRSESHSIKSYSLPTSHEILDKYFV